MQTSIEWLIEQLKERGYAGQFPPHLLFEQAKEMQKSEQETLYTEEQVREAMSMARKLSGVAYTNDEIIQSLKQPKKD
jgi:hypothetical protein